MKKLIITFFLSMFIMCSSAYATNSVDISTSDLTEPQIAELDTLSAKMRTENEIAGRQSKDSNKANVNVNVTIANQVVAMLDTIAIKLNTTPMEVTNSTLGKFILAIVLIKVFGASAFHIIFGIAWLGILIPTWYMIFKKLCVIRDVTYDTDDKGKKIISRITHYTEGSVDGTRVGMVIILLMILGSGLIILFA